MKKLTKCPNFKYPVGLKVKVVKGCRNITSTTGQVQIGGVYTISYQSRFQDNGGLELRHEEHNFYNFLNMYQWNIPEECLEPVNIMDLFEYELGAIEASK